MTSAEVNIARLIKPFPTRRLANISHQAIAYGHQVGVLVTDIQIAQPTTPDQWAQGLQILLGALLNLRDAIDELVPQIEAMQDSADEDYEVAVKAMRAVLAGMRHDES